MCSINHELKAIFIHTPKCSGLFVEKLLEEFYGFTTYYFTHENHLLFTDTKNYKIDNDKGFLFIKKKGVLRYFMSSDKHNTNTNMTIENWNTYKKFAVKRNPYDRFISACKYINKCNNSTLSKTDINKYINKFASEITDYDFFHLYIQQYENLLDTNEEFKIDYMLNFENLNSELCHLLLNLGVKQILHRNILLNNIKINSTGYQNYVYYYNQELIEFVNSNFSLDFEKLGYTKVSNMDELNNDSTRYYVAEKDFIKRNIKLLIDLDSTNQIIQFDDEYYKHAILKNNLQKSNNEKQQLQITDDEIILPTGIRLNTKQEKKPVKDTGDENIHYKNILKAFKKMATKTDINK
jgi:hypothetical protein